MRAVADDAVAHGPDRGASHANARPEPRPTLVPVQVLRAVAALLIVIHHGQNEVALLAGHRGAAFAPSGLLPWPAGVDIFFVISGFIIIHAAGPLYGRPGGRRRFMAHRIARLVPLYWLASGLYLALALAAPSLLSGEGGPPTGRYVLASFLFWPAARPDGAILPLYGLGWTLNYELAFYVLFALALGGGRRAAVACLALAFGLLALLSRLAAPLPVPVAFWAEPIVLEFALGAALGLARAEGVRLPGVVRVGLAAAGIALLALAPDPDPITRPLAWGGPAVLLVAAAALGRARPGASPPGLRWAARLGDASYALYLIHPFALRATREAILRSDAAPALTPGMSLVAMVAVAVLASLAVHRWIERPLTRWLRRLLDPPPAASAGGGTATSA